MRGKIIEHLRYLYQRQMERELKNQFDGRFVAMFHQVEDNPAEWYDNQYAISFEGFVKFVNKLQKAGYEIVSPYDIVKKDGKKKAVLSFDDVFEGVYKYVYPFLREKNVPFVIFPTISKLKEKGYINKEMLIEMSTNYEGCYVGGHGITHCNLRSISREECKKEIIQSKGILEEIIGKKVELFAYPYGDLNAVGRRERSIAGDYFRIAFGTLQTGVTDRSKRNYIPRININDKLQDLEFIK